MASLSITSAPLATRRQVTLNARNVKDEAFPFAFVNSSNTITSQTIQFNLVGANAGDQLTNVLVDVFALGTSTAPTGIYVAAYSTAGAQLAVSANLNSSSLWTAATGPQPVPLTTFSAVAGVTNSSGVFLSDSAFYVAFLQNGAFAGTALQLGRFSVPNGEILKAVSGGAIPVGQQASQATMPSTATIAVSAGACFWMGWN